MPRAELYRNPSARYIKEDKLEVLVEQYGQLAAPLKELYFIRFEGRDYGGDEVDTLITCK